MQRMSTHMSSVQTEEEEIESKSLGFPWTGPMKQAL